MNNDGSDMLRADEFDTLETRFSIRGDFYIFCTMCQHMYGGEDTFVINDHEGHGFHPVDASRFVVLGSGT